MKHALIVAHPNRISFTMTMAQSYGEAARAAGHEVVVRDLYRLNFDPCLHDDELPWTRGTAPRADVAAERNALSGTDVFALVYPFWFNAPPAILKGYVDRVFGPGFAFRPGSFGTEPLLAGKRLISITASGAPRNWVESTGALTALRHVFDDHLAAVCGLVVVDHLHFGRVVPGMRADAVGVCSAAVRSAVNRHFPPESGTQTGKRVG